MEISEREFQTSYLDDAADLASKQRNGSLQIPAALSPVPLLSGPAPDASGGPRIADAAAVDPGETTRILLVDDVTLNLEILRETLRPLGHTLLLASNGRECLSLARQSPPALILLDVMMPEMDGLEVCRQLKADPALTHVPIIFCSAQDDTAAKVRGLDAGAVDFITKPYDPAEIVARVNTHLTLGRLQRGLKMRNSELERALTLAYELRQDALRRMQEALLGRSDAAARLRASIADEAKSSLPLLLLAEASCGDEAVARAIHDSSARRKRPFVAIECGQMVDCDLGAVFQDQPCSNSRSKLALAAGGTLFLSGVQHLPQKAQSRLLQILLAPEAARAAAPGGQDDVRFIASAAVTPTGGGLPAEFDPQLAQKLTRRVLRLPTLAERSDDIPELVNLFLTRHTRALGRVLEPPSELTLSRLCAYSWPGNLRELEDVIRRSIISSRGPLLDVDQGLLSDGIPFGSYRLLHRLGQGGMGEVWEARHQLLARPAAVKLIRPEHLARKNHAVLRRRFECEAKATANLASPHTVTLYDFGVSDEGAFYYVMELLHGTDLQRAVEEFGPMPPSRVTALLVQACRSLAEAHASNLVHRDIKPANLFICKLGLEVDVLKVLDFGMVSGGKSMENTRLSAADEIYGTPECISPEAATGASNLDGRADIYGLGCVAYWMLTGQVVFEAPSGMAMLIKHIQEAPVRPSQRSGLDIPAELEELVMLCLAKERDNRPTALELLDGLHASRLHEAWDDREARAWWMDHLPKIMEP
jgi:DNA-binding NtrC family response regulator